MPTYCVTGGAGLIASHLVKALLRAGHLVRATVRDPDDRKKVGWLWDLEGAGERLELFQADLTIEGSFDEAVDGVDGVFHVASPVLVPYDDDVQETLINPCIQGTMNVLKSCSKSRSVKRVVLTSSCSSIRYRDDASAASPLNESHWSDAEYCVRYNLWYPYAKTTGEREAWRLSEELGLDLVVVNPSFVVGPLISPQPTSTLRFILSIVKGELNPYPNLRVGFIHIDDAVAAHMMAMTNHKASGRLICSSSVMHLSEIVEMLKEKYPSYPIADRCDDRKGDNFPHSMDSSKIMGLGFTGFKSLPQMLEDCIKSFQENGLV